MKRSEIFENFVKIAQKEGLISTSEHAEHTEKDFHETNPRMDSLTIEQIGKLYKTKPSLPKEMEYEHNIIEDAHPNPLVISPSYDKLNGLIENENEGQNIRLRIVMKDPDGHLTNRKYAYKNLLLSLVRVANSLDNRDNEELRKLADTCLMQMADSPEKKIKKTAFPWIIAGVATALGALYAKQHLKFHTDGWEADYNKAISEIDDLLNGNSNLGVGYSYKPEFLQIVNELKTRLSNLNTEIQKALPIIENMELPRDARHLLELSQQSNHQEAVKAVTELTAEMRNELPFINKVINDFNNEGYKQRVISQKGFLSSMVDATEVLHGGAGLIADDFDDVKHALQTLKVDLKNLAQTLGGSQTVTQQASQDLQASQSEVESWLKPQATTVTTPQETTKPEEEKSPESSLEEEAKGLFGRFGL